MRFESAGSLRLRVWLCCGCVASSLACGSQAARREHVTAPLDPRERFSDMPVPAPPPRIPDAACPMLVHGADLLLVDIRGGTALVFTTPFEPPLELRARARRFAALYQTDGGALRARDERASPVGFPTIASHADVVAGARVEIRPVADENLAALRAHVRRRAAHMRATHSC